MEVYVVKKSYQNLGTYEDHVYRYNEFVGVFRDLESAKAGIESGICNSWEIPKHNDTRLEDFYMYDEYYKNNYDKRVLYHEFYIDYKDNAFDDDNYLYLYEITEHEI